MKKPLSIKKHTDEIICAETLQFKIVCIEKHIRLVNC